MRTNKIIGIVAAVLHTLTIDAAPTFFPNSSPSSLIASSYEKTSEIDLVPYISAPKFDGQTPGYVFKTGPQGLGYYLDSVQLNQPQQQQEETVHYFSTYNPPPSISKTLHAGMGSAAFLPASGFHGQTPGYVFKTGPQGLGYYLDSAQLNQPQQQQEETIHYFSTYNTPPSKTNHNEAGPGWASFIPASRFDGEMPGYVFKIGPQGLGYYMDEIQINEARRLQEEFDRKSSSSNREQKKATAPSKSMDNATKSMEPFIPVDKFKDGTPGYIFRVGPQGVGYYVQSTRKSGLPDLVQSVVPQQYSHAPYTSGNIHPPKHAPVETPPDTDILIDLDYKPTFQSPSPPTSTRISNPIDEALDDLAASFYSTDLSLLGNVVPAPTRPMSTDSLLSYNRFQSPSSSDSDSQNTQRSYDGGYSQPVESMPNYYHSDRVHPGTTLPTNSWNTNPSNSFFG